MSFHISGFIREKLTRLFYNEIEDQQGHPGWYPDYLREP